MFKKLLVVVLVLFSLVLVSQTAVAGCCLPPYPSDYSDTTQGECDLIANSTYVSDICSVLEGRGDLAIGCCILADGCVESAYKVACDNWEPDLCDNVPECEEGCCILTKPGQPAFCKFTVFGSCDPALDFEALFGVSGYDFYDFNTSLENDFMCEEIYCPTLEVVATVKLSGVVKDDKGNNLQGVKIVVGSRPAVFSKADGSYELLNIIPGTYGVTASKDNYSSVSESLLLQVNTVKNFDLVYSPVSVKERICNDKLDNDGDGFVDCVDDDCKESPYCRETCSGAGQFCAVDCFVRGRSELDGSCPENNVCCEVVKACSPGCDFVSNTFCEDNVPKTKDLSVVDEKFWYCSKCPLDSECGSCDVFDGVCPSSGCTSLVDADCFAGLGSGSLSGKVTDVQGNPLSGVIVQVGSVAFIQGQSLTDLKGEYSISGLSVGSFEVRAVKDGYETGSDRVSIAAGQTKNFVLGLKEPECTLDVKPVPLDFVGSAVKAESSILLSWRNPCTNLVTGFDLFRDGVALASFDADKRSFVDDVEWDVSYFYELRAKYGASVSDKVNFNVSAGNYLCEGQLGSFCLNADFLDYTAPLDAQVSCDDDNLVQVRFDCGSNNQVCVKRADGSATCKDLTKCEAKGGLLGLFFNKNDCEEGYCYYDFSSTSIDSCFSCSDDMACFNYSSQDACEEDACGVRDCAWKPLSKTLEFNAGICYDASLSVDACEVCNAATSPMYRNIGCSQDVCDLLGNCFSVEDSCISCDASECSDYKDRYVCEGDGSGLNQGCNVWSRSNNPCGVSVCRWDNVTSTCFKDGDGDGLEDLDVSSDVFVPETVPPVVPSVVSSDGYDFNFLVDEDVEFLYYSINDPCPNLTALPDGLGVASVYVDELNSDEGLNTLYYYAVDFNQNVEQTKNFTFFVDSLAPKIEVSYSVKDGSDEFTSDVSISVMVSEKADCSDSFNSGENNLGKVNSTHWSSFYNAEDGGFNYIVTCVDESGNVGQAYTYIKVARDLFFDVANPAPTGRSPVAFTVVSDDPASCSYRANEFVQYSDFSSADGETHTALIALDHGVYVYDLVCYDLNQKPHFKKWTFTVDNVAPSSVMTVTDAQFGKSQSFDSDGFVSGFVSDAELSFNCVDPLIDYGFEFGCDTVLHCTGVDCNPTINGSFNLDYTSNVCFQGVDKGGNKEDKKCGVVRINSIPPTMSISSPLNNSLTTFDTVTIRGSASSPIGIAMVKVYSGGIVVRGEVSNNSWVIEDVPLFEGLNNLKVSVYDSVGLSASKNLFITSDTLGPGLVVDTPVPDGIRLPVNLYGRTFLSRSSNILEGGVSVDLLINDEKKTTVTSGPAEVVAEFDVSSATTGSTVVVDGVGDFSNKYAQSSKNFNDVKAGLDSPKRFKILTSRTIGGITEITLDGSIDEPWSSAIISPNKDQQGIFSVPIGFKRQGLNRVKLVPYDWLDNRGKVYFVDVFYDNVEPKIELDPLTPHEGDVVGSSSSRIKVDLLDNFRIGDGVLVVDDKTKSAFRISDFSVKKGVVDYVVEEDSSQKHTVSVDAFDFVDNFNTYSWSYSYDPDVPTLITVIPKFTNERTLTLDLGFDKPVDSLNFLLNGSSVSSVSKSPTLFSVTFGPVEGFNNISVKATSNGKTGVANRVLIADFTPPKINITSGAVTYTLSPVIRGDYEEGLSGIDRVVVNRALSDLFQSNNEKGEFRDSVDVINDTDIVVSAYDRAGNVNNFTFFIDVKIDELPFRVDNVTPGFKEGFNRFRTSSLDVDISGFVSSSDVDFIYEEYSNDVSKIDNDIFIIPVRLETRHGGEVVNDVNLIGVDYDGVEIAPQVVTIVVDRKSPDRPRFEYR